MYRLARNHTGLVTNHAWDWYLDQAYETAKFMFGRQPNGRRRVGYVELGLMEGDIIVALLEDLKREAWQEKAGDPRKFDEGTCGSLETGVVSIWQRDGLGLDRVRKRSTRGVNTLDTMTKHLSR